MVSFILSTSSSPSITTLSISFSSFCVMLDNKSSPNTRKGYRYVNLDHLLGYCSGDNCVCSSLSYDRKIFLDLKPPMSFYFIFLFLSVHFQFPTNYNFWFYQLRLKEIIYIYILFICVFRTSEQGTFQNNNNFL